MSRKRTHRRNRAGSAASRLRGPAGRLAAGLPAAAVTALATGIALAAGGAAHPPKPTIGSHPAALTNSSSARFTYSDSQAGVGFQCKLDNGQYASCPAVGVAFASRRHARQTSQVRRASTKALVALADGKHTFKVRAIAGTKTSAPATFTWTVDTVPPTAALAVPANGATLSAGSWGHGCPTATALCGSAADAHGVQVVSLSIRSQNGQWWSGSAYDAASETFVTATLSGAGKNKATWSYALPVPAAGSYTVHVRATDVAGNITPASAQASGTFTLAGTPPPPSGKPFTVSGGTTEPLAPGLSRTLALTVTNPNEVAISVTELTATTEPGSSKSGCDGPANLAITQSNVSTGNPLSIPAGGHVTLPLGTVTAPQVLMKDLPTNQDACKNASFTFNYSGSAHS